jgi:hypothetical protein
MRAEHGLGLELVMLRWSPGIGDEAGLLPRHYFTVLEFNLDIGVIPASLDIDTLTGIDPGITSQ